MAAVHDMVTSPGEPKLGRTSCICDQFFSKDLCAQHAAHSMPFEWYSFRSNSIHLHQHLVTELTWVSEVSFCIHFF